MIGPFIRGIMVVVLITIFPKSFAASAQEPAANPPSKELLFLSRYDYADPEIMREFEQTYNAHVRQIYFQSDDMRNVVLAENDGQGYDVVMVNDSIMPFYRQRGWLAPLSEAEIPNIRHVRARWENALPVTRGYGVPYFWGTTGIAYRTDLVPERIVSWDQLFQPIEILRGRILMPPDAGSLVGLALKSLGYSLNSVNLQEIAQAEKLLIAQKPFVKSYSPVVVGPDSQLLEGSVWIAMMYSGDALKLRQYNVDIDYVVPVEGTELRIDYLTVLQSSSQKKLAMAFINFLNEPEKAARMALFTRYATTNAAAEKLLPVEFLHDPDIYPSEAVLEKSEFHAELPPRVLRKLNSIFARILQ
jgi:spermidine/putrescine transport system substrate-binding protein